MLVAESSLYFSKHVSVDSGGPGYAQGAPVQSLQKYIGRVFFVIALCLEFKLCRELAFLLILVDQ